MVNTDYRIKVGFVNHWKVRALTQAAGDGAVLCLLRLWDYAAQHKPKGVLTGMSPREIELTAQWAGPADVLFNALVEAKLIDRRGKSWQFHEWEEHQPYIFNSDEREREAAKKAHKRWHVDGRKPNPDGCFWCAEEMQPASQQHAARKQEASAPRAATRATDGAEDITALFEAFWAGLLATRAPKPVKKKAAEARFRATVKNADTYARMCVALTNYRKSDRVQREFIQDASTWLNDWPQWEHYEEPNGRRNPDQRSAGKTPPEPAADEPRFPHRTIDDVMREQAELATKAALPVRPN